MESVGTGLAKLDVREPRADVYLSRPAKRNAMTVELIEDLRTAFRRAGENDDVRAVTLLGEGKVLCAGMDLEMMRDRADGDDGDDDVDDADDGGRERDEAAGVDGTEPTGRDAFPRLLETIDETPQPVVAGIKRAAPAGAFELTLPCDFRVIGEDAVYGVIEVKLGTFPHGGATQRLPRLVGLSKAKELVLTGEFIDPEEAKACGLVHEVCEPGSVDERTRAFADRLCENAPLGMRRAKTALNAALETPLKRGLEFERTLGRPLSDTRDYREGFEARLEDREPEFEGR